jgi:hypothetical protein
MARDSYSVSDLIARLRHHADEGMFVTDSCAKLLRQAADSLSGLKELEQGDGTYYVTQERAFAPGISGEWPDVIQHPTNRNGRLVKRRWNRSPSATVRTR